MLDQIKSPISCPQSNHNSVNLFMVVELKKLYHYFLDLLALLSIEILVQKIIILIVECGKLIRLKKFYKILWIVDHQ